MKIIQLNKRKRTKNFMKHITMVDDKDFKELSKFDWWVKKHGNTYYVLTNVNGRSIRMHRLIMNAKQNELYDHKDGNGLNNQRSNLRKCSHSENMHNTKKGKKTLSKFKGVSYFQNKWVAYIGLNAKKIHLGYFTTEFEAAQKYNQEAIKLYGKFANLNSFGRSY